VKCSTTGATRSGFSGEITPHDVALFRLSPPGDG
jgi:hypothetical protein